MTDVFIRVFSSNELRLGFAIATVARWKMQKDCRVHILKWSGGVPHDWGSGEFLWYELGNSPENPFATDSLYCSEKLAQSDPYIICNDDNLIYGQNFAEKGLAIMRDYPDFGVIAGRVANDDDNQFTSKERVTEAHAVGGLVFLRKGLVTEFKPLEDNLWDCYRHEQIKAKGFKSGWAHELPYLHMGAHFSIANPGHFNGA